MKMLIMGDVCPTAYTSEYFRAGELTELFSDVIPLFAESDASFVNLECAITERGEPIKKYGPNLAAPNGTAELLKRLGVTCCGLSNNHVYDFGREGIEDTLSALEKNGIKYTGFGKNYEDSRKTLTIERNGERIAIVAVCEHEYSYALPDRMGSRPYDEMTYPDIIRAKAENDRVIVIYHGGKEHCLYPSPRLRRLCHAMAECGADAVICQHSHCIGCYERHGDCHILYGQGNFHFIKPGYAETWYSCLAVGYDTVSGEMTFTPLLADHHTIKVAKGERGEALISAFEARNAELQNGGWLEGWQEFCRRNSANYKKAVAGAGREDSTYDQDHFFAHFLDCEAHTDVWRELFKTAHLTVNK